MSDEQDAARVLAQFQPIGDDDPRVAEFRDAVLDDLVLRPAPCPSLSVVNGSPEHPVSLSAALERISEQLVEIRDLLTGGKS